jgi:hypothetical protein
MDEAVWFRLMFNHCFFLILTGDFRNAEIYKNNPYDIGQLKSLINNKMYFLLDKEQCGILILIVMITNKINFNFNKTTFP